MTEVRGCLVLVDPRLSYGDPGYYCLDNAAGECSLCFIPLCAQHTLDSDIGVLCPDCLNGYLQAEGASDYYPEKE